VRRDSGENEPLVTELREREREIKGGITEEVKITDESETNVG